MSSDISYDDIWTGFLNVEYLILELDFAMWLLIEHDDRPDTTPISLIKEPNEAHEAAIDAYVAEHRAELANRRLECPECGARYSLQTRKTSCPHLRTTWEVRKHGESSERTERRCGAQLKEVEDDFGDTHLRKYAGFALARPHTPEAMRHVVSTWLVQEKYEGRFSQKPEEETWPLSDVLGKLAERMGLQIDRVTFSLARLGDVSRLDGRRNLIPVGAALADKHADYTRTRDKLISCYQNLLAHTREHPEFAELEEEADRPRKFALPIRQPDQEAGICKNATKGQAASRLPDKRSWTQPDLDNAIREYKAKRASSYGDLVRAIEKGKRGAKKAAKELFGRNVIVRELGVRAPSMVSRSEPWTAMAKELGFELRRGQARGSKAAPKRGPIGLELAVEQKSVAEAETQLDLTVQRETKKMISNLPTKEGDPILAKYDAGELTDDQARQLVKTFLDSGA